MWANILKHRSAVIIGEFFWRGIVFGITRGAICALIYMLIVFNFALFSATFYAFYLITGLIIIGIAGGVFCSIVGLLLGVVTLFTRRNKFYKPIVIATAAMAAFLLWAFFQIQISLMFSIDTLNKAYDYDYSGILLMSAIAAFFGGRFGYKIATWQLEANKVKKKNNVIEMSITD